MKKVALVTGSSSGIGLETALALAKDGYKTFASMRDIKKASNLDDAIKKGMPINAIHLDVTKEDSIVSAVKAIMDDSQRIDVLVNNAGYAQFGCVEEITTDDFRRQFETNFFGIVRMIQEVTPIMRKQGSGDIINISSVAGRIGLPGFSAYISSKFALEGLGECLRYELGQFGVRTTLIEPGVIKTNFLDAMEIPKNGHGPQYKKLTNHIMTGLKMMIEMGTPATQVADIIIKAIHEEKMMPRYLIGADATMFIEAKEKKTDIEFEEYMSKELFPR